MWVEELGASHLTHKTEALTVPARALAACPEPVAMSTASERAELQFARMASYSACGYLGLCKL